jgi:type II secretory pathway component GspD/PulD (secretin)
LALVLGFIFVFVRGGRTQDETANPGRAREALRQAIELYKSQDYEKAAPYFAYVKPMQQSLEPADRQDFTKFSASNALALRGRKDGTTMIRLAEDAVQKGRTKDAGNLLKSLDANQYLTAVERQHVLELHLRLQGLLSAAPAPKVKADAKSLLTAGRAALQAGDLTAAEALANQADQASSLLPTWLQPWNDSPAKLRRDIQTARAKQVEIVPLEIVPKSPDPVASDPNKSSAASKFLGLWPFGGSPATPVAKDQYSSGSGPTGSAAKEQHSSERKIDEMMARQIVKDGYVFLQANDLEKAQFLALKAKEMKVTFGPNEQTPDQLLQEIERHKENTKPADLATAPSKSAAESASKADPRALLRQGRSLLEKKKYDEADKLCNQAQAGNGRWGLFEDTPEKLRRDIQRLRASSERDEAVRLMVEARKLLAQGNFEEAQKKAYRAQQLHGPYGPLDFGDRPHKLLEDINRARLAKGAGSPPDKRTGPEESDSASNASNKKGIPFEIPAGIQNANKNRAIVMVREGRELERQGMLADARQKALEARSLKASFLPEEDSPECVLASLTAKCDRQIVAHLQQAVQQAANIADPQRFEKAQVEIVAARKLAHVFQLDSGRIEQTAHQLQEVAAGSRPIQAAGFNLPFADALQANQAAIDVPTGDPKKDQLRKLGREKLRQAQIELSYGKTIQARKMAEELYNPEYGIQADVLKLIRSISAEEYNQQILEAKRNFDAGLEAYMQNDYRKAMVVFGSIDAIMLPEPYQARLRDIMATPPMQPQRSAQSSESSFLKAGKISEPKGPPNPPDDQGTTNPFDEFKAKELVQFQMLRQHGQQALRSAHEMFKQNQQDEAINTLSHYLEQVNLAQLDPKMASELRRLPEARIQQYKTDMAEAKLRGLETSGQFARRWDEGKNQREIRKHQEEVAEKMKVVTELMKQNKLKEAEVEVRKIREFDPDNLAAVAALHIITNKLAQENYDRSVHGNEKIFLQALDPSLGEFATLENPVTFKPGHTGRKQSDGSLQHELRDPKEKAIEYRLRQPISLNFKNVPLEQAINDLTVQSGIQVVADKKAFQDARINLDSLLTFSVENISMKSALNLMLRELGLSYTIEHQVLLITTPDRTSGRLVRITYPVADLIVMVPDHPLPDVLNIQKAIERTMAPNPFYGNNYLTPPPYGFNPGTPVSSHSEGLGGAYGEPGNRWGGSAPGQQGMGGLQGSASKDRTKEAMAEVLRDLIQNTVAKDTWESVGGKGSIQYFPFGMAMVITQPQEVQEEVQLLLATLRKLQDLQVSVELRAVLVSETFFERIGVDFDMNINAPHRAGNAALLAGDLATAKAKGAISGLTAAGTLTPDLGFPIRNSSFNFTTPQFGGYQPEAGLQLGLAFLSEVQVFMFLEAVQGDRRAHIMQAPKLTVFNGQTATIGGLMVRPTVSSLTPAALPNGQLIMIPQPNAMPFGLTMTVQPVVSPDRRFIRLNVTPMLAQGLQDPAGAIVIAVPSAVPAVFDNGNIQPPLPNGPLQVTVQPTTANLNVANTTVNVPDGGTVLLGGFKFLAEERTEYGPPVLSKIPYLSRLFRNVGWSRDGSTLIYLVTARVIMVQEEERLFMGELEPIPGR